MIRVKAGFFSLTAPAPPDDDGSYLRWHLLDHMPVQYQLPDIVHGLRWIADGDYLDHRLAAHGPLGQVGNVVHYLVSNLPVMVCATRDCNTIRRPPIRVSISGRPVAAGETMR